MRIVMSAFGPRGDTQPFVTLGAELRRRGHDVVLCGFREFASLAKTAEVPYLPLEFEGAADLVRNDALAAISGRLAKRVSLERMAELSHCELRMLRALTPGADLALATGANFAWRATAEASGVPARFVGFTPTRFPSAYHEPATRWDSPELVGLDLGPVLAADAAICPLAPDLRSRVVQVPPILPRPSELTPELVSFLAAGEPPVYLGFGRMQSRHPARVARDMVAAVRALRLRSVVLRGWPGLVAEDSPDVFVSDEIPQAALFPRCAAIVHHGGAGTTALAARSGVPQVVVPHLSDEVYWASRMASLGLASEPLPTRNLTTRALRHRLQTVLGDGPHHFHAQVMAERLRGSDGVAEAADVLLR
jgi:UDP:flavonoid glycosyltransferase YjiC (YdhE family)